MPLSSFIQNPVRSIWRLEGKYVDWEKRSWMTPVWWDTWIQWHPGRPTAPPSRSEHVFQITSCRYAITLHFFFHFFPRIECTKSDIVDRNRVDKYNHIVQYWGRASNTLYMYTSNVTSIPTNWRYSYGHAATFKDGQIILVLCLNTAFNMLEPGLYIMPLKW